MSNQDHLKAQKAHENAVSAALRQFEEDTARRKAGLLIETPGGEDLIEMLRRLRG
jgi:hypothetical protein